MSDENKVYPIDENQIVVGLKSIPDFKNKLEIFKCCGFTYGKHKDTGDFYILKEHSTDELKK